MLLNAQFAPSQQLAAICNLTLQQCKAQSYVVHAAVLESQAFGPSQARRDNSQAQSSGAKSETPGQIGGVQLDAATPAGHAMQQATHAEEGGPGQSSDLKAAITDWLDKVFLPAINAEVGPVSK